MSNKMRARRARVQVMPRTHAHKFRLGDGTQEMAVSTLSRQSQEYPGSDTETLEVVALQA